MDKDLKDLIVKHRAKGIFTDAAAPLTINNIGLPAGILNALSTEIIENVTAFRTGDEVLGGRKKLLDWGDDIYTLPFVEKTGKTTPYSDFGQAVHSGMNTSFNQLNQYRFSASWLYGTLQASQYSKAKMDYASIVASASFEALAIEFNRTQFFGKVSESGNDFLCYGLLNSPLLSNYVNSAKTFADMTWEEVMAFFSTVTKGFISQTGNIINGKSRIRCAISASAYADLDSKYTALGISVLETLEKKHKDMYFVPAIELDDANAGQNVVYFIGESAIGGVADTTTTGYSEMGQVGNLVVGDNSWSQTVSTGTIGAVIYKPYMIKRYSNI